MDNTKYKHPTVSLNEIIREFELEVLYAPENMDHIEVSSDDINRPGLQLAGFFEWFEENRMQIMGMSETSFLSQFSSQKRLETFDGDIETLARARRFDELMEVFGPYMRFQLSRECIGGHDFGDMLRYRKPCFVPIDDKVLHGFLMMLLYNNKVGKAVRLLEIRKMQPDYNEKFFEDIEYFIKQFRDSVNCYDIGKYEEGYAMINELYAILKPEDKISISPSFVILFSTIISSPLNTTYSEVLFKT